MFIMTI